MEARKGILKNVNRMKVSGIVFLTCLIALLFFVMSSRFTTSYDQQIEILVNNFDGIIKLSNCLKEMEDDEINDYDLQEVDALASPDIGIVERVFLYSKRYDMPLFIQVISNKNISELDSDSVKVFTINSENELINFWPLDSKTSNVQTK